MADLIIGNVGENKESVLHYGNVVTRAQSKRDVDNVATTEEFRTKIPAVPENINMKEEQAIDPELRKFWEKAKNNDVDHTKQGHITCQVINGYLYRVFTNKFNNKVDEKLIVPSECRGIVLKNAHESVLAGHMSVRKTKHLISSEFFWPKMNKEITEYVKTCLICQKARPPGKFKHIELGLGTLTRYLNTFISF